MEGRTLVRKFAFVVIAAVSLSHLWAQTAADPSTGRKVTARVAPAFPDLARKMHIQGTVRIEAVVRPNGQVKSTRVLGGNPVLVEAASDAVKKWKFEPSPNETTEVIQLSFRAE